MSTAGKNSLRYQLLQTTVALDIRLVWVRANTNSMKVVRRVNIPVDIAVNETINQTVSDEKNINFVKHSFYMGKEFDFESFKSEALKQVVFQKVCLRVYNFNERTKV